jgi:hypothetical protein
MHLRHVPHWREAIMHATAQITDFLKTDCVNYRDCANPTKSLPLPQATVFTD